MDSSIFHNLEPQIKFFISGINNTIYWDEVLYYKYTSFFFPNKIHFFKNYEYIGCFFFFFRTEKELHSVKVTHKEPKGFVDHASKTFHIFIDSFNSAVFILTLYVQIDHIVLFCYCLLSPSFLYFQVLGLLETGNSCLGKIQFSSL